MRTMTRSEFKHARQVARTSIRFAKEAMAALNDTGSLDLLYACTRWHTDVFHPLRETGVDLSTMWVQCCLGPSSGGFGPSIPALAKDPEMKSRFLRHFRMARYAQRKPSPLALLNRIHAGNLS